LKEFGIQAFLDLREMMKRPLKALASLDQRVVGMRADGNLSYVKKIGEGHKTKNKLCFGDMLYVFEHNKTESFFGIL